jgi:hypothetical protein
MAENTLIVTAGDVIEVQLTSETVVIEGAGVRHVEPGHITNRMRLFVREGEGQERKYDFDDTELGVRETQRVAIVRGKLKRVKEPVNLILFNLSSGEQDTFENGLAAYLGRTPFFIAPWKAAGFALLVALVFWLCSNFLVRGGAGGVASIMFAVMFGFLTYPVFWWLCGIWDRVSERMRYRRARKRFIAEMTGRVRAYAPRAPQPTPHAAPAPMPPVAEPPPAAEPSGA